MLSKNLKKKAAIPPLFFLFFATLLLYCMQLYQKQTCFLQNQLQSLSVQFFKKPIYVEDCFSMWVGAL